MLMSVGNVDIGVKLGLPGKAQIGKGMWAKPDNMKEKWLPPSPIIQIRRTCAWVPSPTGATLHAMHYHETNVMDVLDNIKDREPAKLDDILTVPICYGYQLDRWAKTPSLKTTFKVS